MSQFSEKTAIITGASRGIGAETAREFARQGARVVLAARSGSEIEALAEEIRAAGGSALAQTCDVAIWGQVRDLVTRAREAFGRVDFMINNAGVIDPIGRLVDSDPAAWARAADINFTGTYHGVRAVLPLLEAQNSGVIVNISSGAAVNALEGWSMYCASKAAAAMLTRCADRESKSGVRVVGLSPGTVATDMQWRIRASGINPVSQLDPSAHIPADWAAKAVVWLCSEDAAEFAGVDVSLREEAIRKRVGLI